MEEERKSDKNINAANKRRRNYFRKMGTKAVFTYKNKNSVGE